MIETSQQKSPKVFLSHATEDKKRFVIDFAERLREQYIDVWLDDWEIYPGDSLVDKIFEKGLGEADAIIVVISSVSVNKKWVREELNAAVVKRITKGCMLIPVVIEDCEVPEALQSLVWLKITDLNSYSAQLNRVVATIFNQRDKPPLGRPPAYAEPMFPAIAGLSRSDVAVLRAFGDDILVAGDLSAMTEDLWHRAEQFGLPRQEFEDSLCVLSEMGFLEEGKEVAPFPTYFSSTVAGLEVYAQAFLSDYRATKRSVCSVLINTELRDNDKVAEKLGQSVFIVTHVFDELATHGLVRVAHALGGNAWVTNISPRLRRALESEI